MRSYIRPFNLQKRCYFCPTALVRSYIRPFSRQKRRYFCPTAGVRSYTRPFNRQKRWYQHRGPHSRAGILHEYSSGLWRYENKKQLQYTSPCIVYIPWYMVYVCCVRINKLSRLSAISFWHWTKWLQSKKRGGACKKESAKKPSSEFYPVSSWNKKERSACTGRNWRNKLRSRREMY